MNQHLSEIIREWFVHHKRDLPWRRTRSPYHIWLSEIILQQTRVAQGIQYYLRFTETYPDIAHLAAANLDDILRLWQGLGYYSRARSMHQTAKRLVETRQGKFPASYEGLLKLKGIGPYSAAAIASIAFDIPVAAVDGNVFRVLARLFNENTVINGPKAKSVFKDLAEAILNRENPGQHNQAMMELGSLICLPRNPQCDRCPLASYCKAFQTGRVHELPVKAQKKQVRHRFFNYLHITCGEKIFLSRRKGKDIWNSLFEFPMIESSAIIGQNKLITLDAWKQIVNGYSFQIEDVSKVYRHQLTHQLIHATFFRINFMAEETAGDETWLRITPDQLGQFAVPRLIERYLHDLKQGIEH